MIPEESFFGDLLTQPLSSVVDLRRQEGEELNAVVIFLRSLEPGGS